MRIGERLTEHRFIGMFGRGQPPGTQVQAIEPRLARCRQRQHLRLDRIVEARHRQIAQRNQPALRMRHPGDLRDARQQRLRCALAASPDIGHGVIAIEALARALQRGISGMRHHQIGDAGGDHQRNGDGLSAQMPQIANRLFV